jgi:hypothetical protein
MSYDTPEKRRAYETVYRARKREERQLEIERNGLPCPTCAKRRGSEETLRVHRLIAHPEVKP